MEKDYMVHIVLVLNQNVRKKHIDRFLINKFWQDFKQILLDIVQNLLQTYSDLLINSMLTVLLSL